MTTPTTHDVMITLTQKVNALVAYFESARDGFQNALSAAQAGFAALASDLKVVVHDEMHFAATIDPDEANPTNVRGGTFNTLKEAVDASPRGSFVELTLLAGKTYPITAAIFAHNRNIVLKKSGAGANPIVAPAAYDTGSFNAFFPWRFHEGGSLKHENTDVVLPGKADPAKGWSSDSCYYGYHPGIVGTLGLMGCNVTGAAQGLISAHTGTVANLSLNNVTLDGAMFGVKNASAGVALIAHYGVTLQNGAALNDSGTLGVSLLKTP